MAKTPVTLKIDGFEDREVASVNYTFDQAIDKENQPAGIPRGGKITINCKAMNDGNDQLVGWMLDPVMTKKGKVVFINTSDNKLQREIQFEGAYCVSFTENWEDATEDTSLAHTEEIVLSCKKIKVGSVTLENEWK